MKNLHIMTFFCVNFINQIIRIGILKKIRVDFFINFVLIITNEWKLLKLNFNRPLKRN